MKRKIKRYASRANNEHNTRFCLFLPQSNTVGHIKFLSLPPLILTLLIGQEEHKPTWNIFSFTQTHNNNWDQKFCHFLGNNSENCLCSVTKRIRNFSQKAQCVKVQRTFLRQCLRKFLFMSDIIQCLVRAIFTHESSNSKKNRI